MVNKSDLGIDNIDQEFKKFNPIYISLKKERIVPWWEKEYSYFDLGDKKSPCGHGDTVARRDFMFSICRNQDSEFSQ